MGILDSLTNNIEKKTVERGCFSFYDDERWTAWRRVMINPSEINYNSKSSLCKKKTGIGLNKKQEKISKQNYGVLSTTPPKSSLQMLLIFDLISRYEMQDGLTDVLKNINEDLHVDDKTCYYNLKEAARRGLLTKFVWGSIQIGGKITSFDSKYTYFTEAGNPVRAEVSLKIEEEDLSVCGRSYDDYELDNIFKTERDLFLKE